MIPRFSRGHWEPRKSYREKVSLNKAQPDIDSWNLWTISKEKENEKGQAHRLTRARWLRLCRRPRALLLLFLSLLARGLRRPFTGGWREVCWN
jgi:hypothetical protein